MTNMPGGLIEVKVVPGGLPQNWQRIKGIRDECRANDRFRLLMLSQPPFLKV